LNDSGNACVIYTYFACVLCRWQRETNSGCRLPLGAVLSGLRSRTWGWTKTSRCVCVHVCVCVCARACPCVHVCVCACTCACVSCVYNVCISLRGTCLCQTAMNATQKRLEQLDVGTRPLLFNSKALLTLASEVSEWIQFSSVCIFGLCQYLGSITQYV